MGSLPTFASADAGRPFRPPSATYLDKVHLDIVYGDTISKLGFSYAILLIDRVTKYMWFYGLRSLVSACITNALEQFRADAGGLPKQFRCDCDQKLLGDEARRWIYRQKSNIIGAPAGRQSANGLAERAWATVCAMARVLDRGTDATWLLIPCHPARVQDDQPDPSQGRWEAHHPF